MRKIVINKCYGGFGLSDFALNLLGLSCNDYPVINRDDARLVEIVEKWGELCNDKYAKLKVVSIPDDVQWHIEDYDGMEKVAENHRVWY